MLSPFPHQQLQIGSILHKQHDPWLQAGPSLGQLVNGFLTKPGSPLMSPFQKAATRTPLRAGALRRVHAILEPHHSGLELPAQGLISDRELLRQLSEWSSGTATWTGFEGDNDCLQGAVMRGI